MTPRRIREARTRRHGRPVVLRFNGHAVLDAETAAVVRDRWLACIRHREPFVVGRDWEVIR